LPYEKPLVLSTVYAKERIMTMPTYLFAPAPPGISSRRLLWSPCPSCATEGVLKVRFVKEVAGKFVIPKGVKMIESVGCVPCPNTGDTSSQAVIEF
jgi:type II secretory ATPase GspE/PulE/Tfp pilus assembly ATPase PilB-like protein